MFYHVIKFFKLTYNLIMLSFIYHYVKLLQASPVISTCQVLNLFQKKLLVKVL
jgi:hypothetical protein